MKGIFTEGILMGLVGMTTSAELRPDFQEQELTSQGLLSLGNQGFSDDVWKLRAQRLSVLSGAWGRLPPALSSLLSRPC